MHCDLRLNGSQAVARGRSYCLRDVIQDSGYLGLRGVLVEAARVTGCGEVKRDGHNRIGKRSVRHSEKSRPGLDLQGDHARHVKVRQVATYPGIPGSRVLDKEEVEFRNR